ncbi:vacuolar protein sorting-associated protein 32 homolog 1-like [Brassica napus]|nr:vacuolar protein sorting-associated protein 32 homolog 1-like [Brassica napus]
MDEINEQTDNMRQIQDALSAPFGSDFDEVNFPFIPTITYFYQIFSTLSVWEKLQDELEAELEELESAELEEELLEPVRPVQNLPEGKQPARPATQKKQTAYEDELAALQADMAL